MPELTVTSLGKPAPRPHADSSVSSVLPKRPPSPIPALLSLCFEPQEDVAPFAAGAQVRPDPQELLDTVVAVSHMALEESRGFFGI